MIQVRLLVHNQSLRSPRNPATAARVFRIAVAAAVHGEAVKEAANQAVPVEVAIRAGRRGVVQAVAEDQTEAKVPAVRIAVEEVTIVSVVQPVQLQLPKTGRGANLVVRNLLPAVHHRVASVVILPTLAVVGRYASVTRMEDKSRNGGPTNPHVQGEKSHGSWLTVRRALRSMNSAGSSGTRRALSRASTPRRPEAWMNADASTK